MAVLSPDLKAKLDRLSDILSSYGNVIVAFSGGLDSGFLVYMAVRTLGVTNVLAATGDSESLSTGDREFARKFAETIGLSDRHVFVRTEEIKDENYASNPPDRCYFCKRHLYGRLRQLARELGIEHILDGSNASDVDDRRPGKRACAELSIESPLLYAGLSKDEIRDVARHEGLEIWDKPQAACLSSRIPYGEAITAGKLDMIDEAETYLREIGFRQFRVRHHGPIARIELEEWDVPHMLDSRLRARIVERLREIGFLWVTMDLAGFRSGSMNVALEEGKEDE